jgi:PAS domain S-box-containing protein/putative nucleotidyltransferase with HDIG domain
MPHGPTLLSSSSTDPSEQELAELRARLQDAEATLRAIRSGEVDAISVDTPKGLKVFTLEGAEHPYRTLIETMNEGAAMVSSDGTIVYCNQRLADMLKLDLHAVIGSPFPDHFAGDDREKIARALPSTPEEAIRSRARLIAADGNLVPVNVALRIIADSDSPKLATVVSDLSEVMAVQDELETYRRHLEQLVAARTTELTRTNRALRTLGLGNEMMVRANDENQLLNDMCRAIIGAGDYRMVWIGKAESDDARSVHPVAWAGDVGDYLERAAITWADEPHGRGPTGCAIRTGQPQKGRLFEYDNSMGPWRAAAIEKGFAATAAFPVAFGRNYSGALTIYSSESDAFGPGELTVLSQLADDLGYAIQSLRSRHERDDAIERWRRSLDRTVAAIANTLELRDHYTAGHQRRVAQLATAIAEALGVSEDDVRGIELAAKIHDVGKINLPTEILSKPGKLHDLEFDLIKGHAEAGYRILKDIDFPWPIADMVRQHHERLDGSGYPLGLDGEKILRGSRILAVADVVEAMMSRRPYRVELGIDAALGEIEKGKGRLYDAAAVDACIALFRGGGFRFSSAEAPRS